MSTPRENPETNIPQERHERLCAYVFGELQGDERAAFEAELAASPALRAEQARLEATIGLVKQAMPDTGLSQDARRDLYASARRSRFRVLRGRGLALVAAAFVALIGGGLALRWFGGDDVKGPFLYDLGGQVARAPAPEASPARRKESEAQADARESFAKSQRHDPVEVADAAPLEEPVLKDEVSAVDLNGFSGGTGGPPAEVHMSQVQGGSDSVLALSAGKELAARPEAQTGTEGWFLGQGEKKVEAELVSIGGGAGRKFGGQFRGAGDTVPPGGGKGGGGAIAPSASGPAGPSSPGPGGPGAPAVLQYRARAEVLPPATVGGAGPTTPGSSGNELALRALGYGSGDDKALGEKALADLGDEETSEEDRSAGDRRGRVSLWMNTRQPVPPTPQEVRERAQLLCGLACLQPGESARDMFFRYWGDNPFVPTADDTLSTFAVDVDTASYTLTRAYLNRGQLPPREAVRTEEFVNYFRADQPAASDGSPFAIGLELAPTPFTPDPRTELLRVTVRAKDIADFERQPLALTFVVDVSGSMNGQRIGFVKDALTTLLGQLYAGDSVAIVAFSNESREVSPMVSAGNRGPLEQAIAGLTTGGGTNVEAGLRQGYALASAALTRSAVNRVILCSDGVGNIGETKGDALLALVAEQRAKGIYLNTVGVGMGNHNDAFLEQLADKGDGLCQYVDSAAEAQKVFGQDLAKALQPVARDVKIQVEFDPSQVEAWRQLGYENRALRHEDFRNDAIDAGEVNAGHQVTALYEVVRTANPGGPLATVRVRYKPPFPVDRGDTSELGRVESEAAREIERAISFSDSRPGFVAGSPGFRRSAIAAQLAEVLRRSQHARGDSLAKLADAAQALANQSDDPEVDELAELVAKARPLVEARDAQETPRVEQLLDRLARLHYERGQRERKRLEVDEETLAREQAEIERLEAEVRVALGERMGIDPEQLQDIGYAEGDEESAENQR